MSYAINSAQTGWRAVNSQADLLAGETYSATQPVLSLPATPLNATPYQFKAALNQQGLYTAALAAVNAGPLLTQLAWSEAQTFLETDALIVQMATALGKTTADIHALFQLAQTLSP